MAYDVLAGVKVVEVAAWLFAPSCGAIQASHHTSFNPWLR